MFRFFRQLRKEQLMSDKTRKYILYAVGEILLVVIGILIALQVNNWNEDRKERQAEVNYMVQLLEDAREDSAFFQSRLLLLTQNQSDLRRVLADDQQSWEDSVQAVIQDSLFLFYFRVVHDSFLISNNPDPFLNISDRQLKKILRDYQNAHNYVSIATEYLNRIVEQHGIPLELKYSASIGRLQDRSITLQEAKAMFRNEDVQAAMRMFSTLSDNAINQLSPFLEVNALLIDQLNAKLAQY